MLPRINLRQAKLIKNNDTLKEHAFIPTGYTVAVQREEEALDKRHITEHSDDEHSGRSYKYRY